jgi:DNA-binding NtrC family response regulator
LVAVRDAVVAVGGHLGVETLLGEGTVVHVYLPRAVQSRTRETSPAATVPSGQDRAVLLCDDDRLVRMATKDVLEAAGYRVFDASTSEDARSLFAATPEIELLVTDIHLRGSSGSELAESLSAQRHSLRVLLVSGHRPTESDAGPTYTFLPKPFTPATLLSSLEGLYRHPRSEL